MTRLLIRLLPALLAIPVSGAWRPLPLSFEPNHGQAGSRVDFLAHGEGYGIFLSGAEAVLALRGSAESATVRMSFAGAPGRAAAEGLEPLAARSHYFLGSDPRRWRANIPNFARVRFRDVYPGIDVVYYGNQGRLEFDLLVAAGADPGRIRLRYGGAETLRVNSAGDLRIGVGASTVRQLKPRVLQEGRTINSAYVVNGAEVTLRLAGYDPARALSIDPVVVYASYLGGDGAATGGNDYGRAVAVDASGNIYVAGSTESARLPVTTGAAQSAPGGGVDAFLMKLDPAGATCLYATYLGGWSRDEAFAVAVDSAGNAYLTGTTSSSNFPVTSGAAQAKLAGYTNAFVTKFDASGAVAYSTFLGGEMMDYAAAIAADGSGSAFVAGYTYSTKFPTTADAFQRTLRGSQNAFAAKLDSSGTALAYSTYLGGATAETGSAIAVDAAGNAYVAGQTWSRDFPVTADAFRKTLAGGTDAFVAKLNDSGTGLVYSTFLGGSGNEAATAIALDAANNAYVAGSTDSRNLPVTRDAAQAAYGGALDGFLATLNDTGSALLYCTYLGGAGRDVANAIALDPGGSVWVGGETQSQDFFVSGNALQAAHGGGAVDGFAAKFGPDMARVYSTYLGAEGEDRILALVSDASGNVRAAGYTASIKFPCTPGALQPALLPGGFDAFLAGFDAAGPSLAFATYLGGSGASPDERAQDLALDRDGNVYITGQTFSTNFPATAGSLQTTRGGGIFGDAFVAKVSADGTSLIYATYLGGGGDDAGAGIAVDDSGAAYVAGTTSSANFPATAGAFQTTLKGTADAFVAKLSPDGSSLAYSTLLGGSGTENGAAIAVDADGSAYVAGGTYSQNFPVTAGALRTTPAGSMDAFVAKLSADGTALVYSTFLGGQSSDNAAAIALDADRNACVTGTTYSKNFPVTAGAAQTAMSGSSDAFASKLDAAGVSLLYSTFVGGSGAEQGRRIAVDGSGNAFVAGITWSADFPVTAGAYQTAAGGGGDAFLAKLQPDGAGLVYATLLGGSSSDDVGGLAIDSDGNAYLAGNTYSFVFPATPDRFQTGLRGGPDAFLARFDPEGKSLLFSSQYGFGGGKTIANAVAVDGSGKVYMAGQTSSPNFHTSAGAFQRWAGGPANAFFAKFDLSVPTPDLTPVISRVVNFATGDDPICGGGIITIQGRNLAINTVEFAKPLDKLSGSLPTKLGSTVVRFGVNNRAIPLFSVGPEAIVAQLPYAALDSTGEITVTVDTETSKPFRPLEVGAAFGVFGVYKQDMTPLTSDTHLKPGDTFVAYVTGFGKTSPSVATGAPAPDSAVTVTTDPYVNLEQSGYANMRCDGTRITLVPGLVGVAQALVTIDPRLSSDITEWDLTFRVSGVASNKVRIWIDSAAP